MVDVSREAVVAAYWTQHRLRQGGREDRLRADEYFWAWEVVHEAVWSGAPDVLDLLDALLEADGAEPGYFGAGPLEELLNSWPNKFASGIAERARRDPRWREALRGVWWPRRMSEPAATILKDFAPLPRLKASSVSNARPTNRAKSVRRGRGRRDR